jgi:hypothetical protein
VVKQSLPIKALQAGYVLMSFLAAAFFVQTDLSHTVFSSYALLRGHFFDFYDFNQPAMVGNDYLILLYGVIALWMSPIYFLGLTTPTEQFNLLLANPAEVVWAKVGLAILFVILANRVQKIASNFFAEKSNSGSKWIVLTSPFALLPVLVMGQYDAIGLLLVILGFEAWLGKRHLHFVAYFAFALSFKYIALAVFIPLVLIAAKNLRQAAGWLSLALIPIVFQIGLGLTNAAYRSNASLQPMKLLMPDLSSPVSVSIRLVALVLGIVVGIWLLQKKYESELAKKHFAVIAVVASLTTLFIAVRWNPQWLIYIVPFWALLLLQMKRPRLQMISESLGFVGLVWMLANPWMNNVDDSMAMRGALSQLLPDRVLRLNDFYSPDLLMLGVILIHLAIVAPLALRCWELFVDRRNRQAAQTHFEPLGYFWMLRPIAFLVAFLVPISLCYFTPPSIAKTISANVEINSLNRMPFGQMHRTKLQLNAGEVMVESLVMPETRVQAVQIDIATAGRRVSGAIGLEIYLDKTLVSVTKATLMDAKDSSFPGFSGWLPVSFRLSEDLDLQGKRVELKLTNRTEKTISFWVDDVRPESVDIKLPSGEVASGSIVMTFLEAKAERRGN